MRDNFKESEKEILAKRVAYRCSFPGCPAVTIGPGSKSSTHTIKTGVAAHIYAASEGGPRYNPNMTSEERSSIDNAIWMCEYHGAIIDKDYEKYAADTIKQWKSIAEENATKNLQNPFSIIDTLPTTLVSIGSQLIFEGVWKGVVNNESELKFDIYRFAYGDIEKLREISISNNTISNYVIIETQGDGRKLRKNIQWQLVNNRYEVTLTVDEKSARTNPDTLSDIAADFSFEDGDIKMVKGIDCAIQHVESALSIGFGELKYAPMLGSYFSDYYWQHKDNLAFLNRLLKLELTRLIFIPEKSSWDSSEEAPLNFINRILDARVLSTTIEKHRIPIRLNLEWGNGSLWEGDLKIYIKNKNYHVVDDDDF